MKKCKGKREVTQIEIVALYTYLVLGLVLLQNLSSLF